MTSFILDPSVQHAFTSPHFTTLQDTATELISGEAAMRKAFGGLWRVLQGDLQRRDRDTESSESQEAERWEEEEGEEDVRDLLRRSRPADTSQPEIPPLSHLFVTSMPVSLGGAPSLQPPSSSNTLISDAVERLISPQSQLETFEWCIGVMRELADHGKEYLARLEEIRNGLGEAGAVRREVWGACRRGALEELERDDGRSP